MPSRRIIQISCVLLSLLLLGCGSLIWHRTGVGNLRAYTERAVIFQGEHLRLPSSLSGPGRIRVVHFWDPDCPCNKETDAHLNYIIEMYRYAGIDFYSVQKPGSRGQLPKFLEGKLTPLIGMQGVETLPASPAIAIWDTNGTLSYAGPYSEGLICNSSNSFVESIIDALVAGRSVKLSEFIAIGCYCPWKPDSNLNVTNTPIS